MKITFEDGHIVLRDDKGILCWNIHTIDIESSHEAPALYSVDFVGTITTTTPTGLIKTKVIP